MGTNYRVELGFNWNAPQISESLDGGALYPLQIALVNLDTQGPAFFSSFLAGDTLDFRVFNISDILNGTPAMPIEGYEVAQRELDAGFIQVTAEGRNKRSPFGPPVTSWTPETMADTESSFAYSTTHQEFGYAIAQASELGSENKIDRATFVVESWQVYELAVGVTVWKTDETGIEERRFIVDPELIVGPSGG